MGGVVVARPDINGVRPAPGDFWAVRMSNCAVVVDFRGVVIVVVVVEAGWVRDEAEGSRSCGGIRTLSLWRTARDAYLKVKIARGWSSTSSQSVFFSAIWREDHAEVGMVMMTYCRTSKPGPLAPRWRSRV